MDIKQKVLQILEANRDTTVNGATLAKDLSVSRNSVWKAMKSLQQEGYLIEAITNKGYRLLPGNNILSAESITPYLRGEASNFNLEVRQSVTSTNIIAKELATQGAKAGTVIIAREQTAGRGRMGRSFYSPTDSGIYLSIILRPVINLEDSLLITTAVAVAVAKAIETTAQVKADIKWVNDIYVSDKKVCGILTEAAMNFENGSLEYAVVGIGINIETKDFPSEIKDIAGSIFTDKPKNNPVSSILTAAVLSNIAECMNSLTDKKYIEEYRSRSFLIGKDIYVIKGSKTTPAKAIAIDEKARLIVEYEDNTQETLNSGEVSIRIQK